MTSLGLTSPTKARVDTPQRVVLRGLFGNLPFHVAEAHRDRTKLNLDYALTMKKQFEEDMFAAEVECKRKGIEVSATLKPEQYSQAVYGAFTSAKKNHTDCENYVKALQTTLTELVDFIRDVDEFIDLSKDQEEAVFSAAAGRPTDEIVLLRKRMGLSRDFLPSIAEREKVERVAVKNARSKTPTRGRQTPRIALDDDDRSEAGWGGNR